MSNSPKDFYWTLLAELRKEILESQKIRAQVIGFKITFVSAGIGFIAANLDKVPREVLVVPAFAAIFFDFLIESYSFSIKRIGFYCRSHIENHIREQWGLPPGFVTWEEFMKTPAAKQMFSTVGNLGLTLLAVAPACVALWYSPFRWGVLALALLFVYDAYVYYWVGRIREIGLGGKDDGAPPPTVQAGG